MEMTIDDLLSDILNDSKPLPTAPTVAQAVVHTQVNAAGGNAGEAAMDNPDDFLAALMAATPEQVAVHAEVSGEMALAEALPATPQSVTQSVTAESLFTDTDARNGIQVKLPEFTAEDFAATFDIRNFATLVSLNTARWHAKVKDRGASKNAAIATEADENSFETRKRLLVGADTELRKIHKAIDEARAAHYSMTLPWSTTGMSDSGRRTGGRLLPNTLFVEYTTIMAAKLAAMKTAVNEFIPLYPALIETAKVKLGKSFDPTEYPNASSIAAHFDLSFDFQPIPQGDDFKGLPQVQLDALAAKVNDNLRIQAEHAMQDLWVRTREAVDRMAERLSSPDKLFHNSLVENVREVCKLLGHLNVTRDLRVEDIRQKIEKHLVGNDAKTLRENPVLRLETGAHAVSIIQEMDK